MNWKRIVAGGLLAGVVFNVLEFALEPFTGSLMDDTFGRLGLPTPSEGAMLAMAASTLVLGVLTVWLYAAIRPRYGAGPRTAVLAGLAVWALSCLLPNIVLYAFGVFTGPFFWAATICPLVESILAALAGAWVYVEEPRGHSEMVRSPA